MLEDFCGLASLKSSGPGTEICSLVRGAPRFFTTLSLVFSLGLFVPRNRSRLSIREGVSLGARLTARNIRLRSLQACLLVRLVPFLLFPGGLAISGKFAAGAQRGLGSDFGASPSHRRPLAGRKLCGLPVGNLSRAGQSFGVVDGGPFSRTATGHPVKREGRSFFHSRGGLPIQSSFAASAGFSQSAQF